MQREWTNEILALEKARVMNVEEMNGSINCTCTNHCGWWCTFQRAAKLRNIMEKAGILKPGRSGGRLGRSTDLATLARVTITQWRH